MTDFGDSITRMTTMEKIEAIRTVAHPAYLLAYFDLVDMGEIKESDSMRKRCAKLDGVKDPHS